MHSAANVNHPIVIILLDSCTINNGGCGDNTICSHDSATYAVRCRCKIGYTNTGSSARLNCTGTTRYAVNTEAHWSFPLQTAAPSTMVAVVLMRSVHMNQPHLRPSVSANQDTPTSAHRRMSFAQVHQLHFDRINLQSVHPSSSLRCRQLFSEQRWM